MTDSLRQDILDQVRAYATQALAPKPFVPGNAAIPPAGKVLGPDEIALMVDAALDGWLTTGRFNTEFEARLADYVGVAHATTTNSGSSANLLAVTALTSPKLGDRALKPGDEVITAAAGFPTTVNPIFQNGLVPVFVDSVLGTYNPSVDAVRDAITPRTKAIILAHTLGNPFAVAEMRALADAHGLWLIEDCCDALGSRYQDRKVGTFGHLATLSFYPAHHITMGEGGAVLTNDLTLRQIVESFRDWGRDCWCHTGCDNTCGKRFDWQLGDLPRGYDHKYVYSHIGYNLKITDMQAACGLAQLEKVEAFGAARRAHFAHLHTRLAPVADQFILPEATPGSDPSWFGFPLTVRPEAGFSRLDLIRYLDQHKIGTRLLFAGNITRQPALAGQSYRIHCALTQADRIMESTFWLGVWPGLETAALDYVADTLNTFCGVGF